MASANETPIQLNMPASPTAQTIGLRKVNIRTKGQENWRITVILTILASGEKLASLLIFKEEEGKDAETKLQQIEWVEKMGFCILTIKCMEQWKYISKMDSWSMMKILHFQLKMKTL